MLIRLEGITLHAFHGVLPEERQQGNTYIVNVALRLPDPKAVETDRLEDTVDYGAIYQVVREQMAIPSQLLEHVAGRILRRLSEQWPDYHWQVEVKKQHPPVGGEVDWASVRVEN